MRNIFTILTLLFSVFYYSQSTEVLSKEPHIQYDKIYTDADENAEFPGGINAFRNKVMQTFDSGNITGTGLLKSETSFIIDKNGKLNNVKCFGDKSLCKEMVRTVSKIRENWTPAKVKGEAVNYKFRLPITMNL